MTPEGTKQIGSMLAHALDWIRSRIISPEDYFVGIYFGRKDDPESGVMIGNAEPQQFHAAIGVLIMDATKLGTIDSDDNLTMDEDKD
ncbi:MAG: hypothetical protein ABW128_06975 [Rhizorhabdus sp.]